MKRISLPLIALLVCTGAFAQGIGKAELKEIRASFVKDEATIATQKALMSTIDIDGLARDKDYKSRISHTFNNVVTPLKSAPSQYASGRCWLFSSLNYTRPLAIEKYNVDDFRWSHLFCSFWDLFEKCNQRLEYAIAAAGKPIDDRENDFYVRAIRDGGEWNGFVNIARKYGVVPESVIPETVNSNNTERMHEFMNIRVRKAIMEIREKAASGSSAEQLKAVKMDALKDIYRILALCFGEPPVEFTWNYTDKDGERHSITTTPKEFAAETIPAEFIDSRVMLVNDPSHEYYKVYRLDGLSNCIEGIHWTYLNLPPEELKSASLAAIRNNEAVYVCCDWTKERITGENYMDLNNYRLDELFGMDFDMTKEAMIKTRYSTAAHVMLVDACQTDANGKTERWRLFNSSFRTGCGVNLSFTDEWFDAYVHRVVTARKYLSDKAQAALDQEPVILPLYIFDYMK